MSLLGETSRKAISPAAACWNRRISHSTVTLGLPCIRENPVQIEILRGLCWVLIYAVMLRAVKNSYRWLHVYSFRRNVKLLRKSQSWMFTARRFPKQKLSLTVFKRMSTIRSKSLYCTSVPLRQQHNSEAPKEKHVCVRVCVRVVILT